MRTSRATSRWRRRPTVLRSAFPIIDKDTLLANRDRLYPEQAASRQPWQAPGKTSGTTGAPLTVFRSVQSLLMEQAFVKRHWAWGGYHDGMVRATLRGDLVVGVNRPSRRSGSGTATTGSCWCRRAT